MSFVQLLVNLNAVKSSIFLVDYAVLFPTPVLQPPLKLHRQSLTALMAVNITPNYDIVPH